MESMYGEDLVPASNAFESRLYECENVRQARELVLRTSAKVDAKRIYLPSHINFDLWKRFVSDEAKKTMGRIPFVDMHELRDWDRRGDDVEEEDQNSGEESGEQDDDGGNGSGMAASTNRNSLSTDSEEGSRKRRRRALIQ
jgi:hypothetical protein